MITNSCVCERWTQRQTLSPLSLGAGYLLLVGHLPLTHTRSYTHTHRHACTCSHNHAYTHSQSCLHMLTNAHTCTVMLALTLSYTYTHNHAYTCSHSRPGSPPASSGCSFSCVQAHVGGAGPSARVCALGQCMPPVCPVS